jgi:PAS domain S-box-containing protein
VQNERARILIVDDRRENLLALEAALASDEYEIVLADSGRKALGELLGPDFAVILLDVSMPEMDGFEVARMIRGRDKTRHVPILFVTAFMSDAAQIFRGYEQGAVDYLVKPLDIHALKMKVAVFADLWRYARRAERAEHRERVIAEELYEATFAEAPIGIGHVSADMKWLRLNARMASMLGARPDALRGRKLVDCVHPDDRDTLVAHINSVLAGQERRHRGQYRLVGAEGGEVWIKLTMSVICDPERKPVQLVIVEDITEEKRLTRELDWSERRFARLRESGLLGIYEENTEGAISGANGAFLAMLGYDREDLDGGAVRISQILAPEAESIDATVSGELAPPGASVARERIFVRKDGRQGVMLAGAVKNGVVVGFALDVTAMREAADVRDRSARELDSSLRSRDDFLALLAHELRNPLTPLTMQLASLRASVATATAPLDGHWVSEQLVIAQRATTRLVSLVDELLLVSRATVGGFELERANVDLVELTRGVIARCSEALERARCTVTIEADGVLVGSWDRVALDRVVAHLLSNSMKYGAGRPIEISISSAGDGVKLVVRDHGSGIPAEHRDHLFERFARFAPLQHHGGFGVGLWLARRIVEAHGGTIEVGDPPGEGALFTVWLPRRPPSDALAQKTKGEDMTQQASRPHVLLVDDDDDVREILQMGLTAAGYEVRGAANGREALDAISHERPDLVLLDMMMPVMSGPEFLEEVGHDPALRDLPILVVTAWPAEAASLEGTKGVLSKPVDLGHLVRTIDRTLH